MAFTEDLDAFLDTDEFAVTATLAGGAVSVIFDKAYLAALGGQADATEPMCLLKSSDVTAHALAFGSAITIAGTAYTVRGIHPDGTGLTSLLLELA
jgi:hypothetical protein